MSTGSTLHRASTYALTLMLLAGTVCADTPQAHNEHDDESWDTLATREAAQQRVHWDDGEQRDAMSSHAHVKILAINDFHGQLSIGKRVGNRPVGGAAVLAAYLRNAESGVEDSTFIVHAGDHVGASPPASALLQDEPSIGVLNLLANNECEYPERERGERKASIPQRGNARCNIVGTLGNHEFDEGKDEMLRLLRGGNHAKGPYLENPYRGARFPYVSANVVDAVSGKPILPPYVIKQANGERIAFIGAVLKATPTIVTPQGVAGLRFLDEADAINRYIPEIKARGVRAIVVLIHQGGRQNNYIGPTQSTATVTGEIAGIVARLDDEIDVVVSGHTHAFTNALLKNAHGKEILVTQAFSAGTAYADIDLEIDRRTHDVVEKSAAIVTTFGDAGPGLTPDPTVAQLVADAEARVAPLVERVVGTASANITREQNAAGESALGNLIADAQRAAMNTDFAFMNPGGIRADISAGPVSWGDLFTVQPFNNDVMKMTLTGAQIYTLLNQQWASQPYPRLLQVSGLSYTWDNARPTGARVVEVRKAGVPIDVNALYTVAVNSFIAGGGDNFTVLTAGTNRVVGPVDLDALVVYVETHAQPFSASIEGRIVRLN